MDMFVGLAGLRLVIKILNLNLATYPLQVD